MTKNKLKEVRKFLKDADKEISQSGVAFEQATGHPPRHKHVKPKARLHDKKSKKAKHAEAHYKPPYLADLGIDPDWSKDRLIEEMAEAIERHRNDGRTINARLDAAQHA